ncbi:MAG: protein phosphatase 2C domain-containing protein, partial [Anaerolineales bacterium]
IISAALTHPGQERPNNEDFVAFHDPTSQTDLQSSGRLYIVADGVGGASLGERASQYAAQKVLQEYYLHPDMEPGARLSQFIRQAGNDIYDFAEKSSHLRRMATTIVAAVIRGSTLTVANVGDSRAYLIRDRKAVQITRDHSLVGEMMRNGFMSEEEAMKSKFKNRITRSVGGEKDVRVDIFDDIKVRGGDQMLLCSDGLTSYATRTDLVDMSQQGTPDEIASRMVDFANQKGGSDNISVVMVAIREQVSSQDPTLIA